MSTRIVGSDGAVGLDIEMAPRLARDLGVGVEFVPVELDRAPEQLRRDDYDIIMSGIVVTPRRAAAILFSVSLLQFFGVQQFFTLQVASVFFFVLIGILLGALVVYRPF